MTETKVKSPGTCPFDPYSAALSHTTDAAYAWMRAERPVYQLPGRNVFLITRYDDIIAAARDIETFSNEFISPGLALGEGSSAISEELAAVRATGYPQVSTMLTRDPPAHDRFRRLTTRAFTARRIASWEPHIERIVEELIDGFIDAGEVEFVSGFAVPLPVRVIATPLGFPASVSATSKPGPTTPPPRSVPTPATRVASRQPAVWWHSSATSPASSRIVGRILARLPDRSTQRRDRSR